MIFDKAHLSFLPQLSVIKNGPFLFEKSKVSDSTFLAPPKYDLIPTDMMKLIFLQKNRTNFTSCPVTSQVRIIESPDQWKLQSLTIDGEAKTVGGDEYYITYADDSMSSSSILTAVAFVSDCQDGSYDLRFVTSPSLNATTKLSGIGRVTIILQYSCGLGHLAPPVKLNWNTGGAINSRHVVKNRRAPPMETFVPPSGIDLTRYEQVVAIGDSTMKHFVEHNQPNTFWPGHVGGALSLETVDKPFPRTNKMMNPSFLSQIQSHVTSTREKFRNVALLMGSGVWDILADDVIQDPEFQDHRAAVRLLITSVRQEFPDIDLYWKSHTAMHVHRVADQNDWQQVRRVFYMSSSRSHDLYQYQKDIMAELNVTLLDLYPATYLSAELLEFGDGRHYTKEFNKRLLDWFYPHGRE
jgi:hypothetical protein